LTLSAAPIALEAVTGEEQRAAFALRDGSTLLVSADMPETERRGQLVAWVRAIARMARDREGMASAVEK
jgi:hypothetical protein